MSPTRRNETASNTTPTNYPIKDKLPFPLASQLCNRVHPKSPTDGGCTFVGHGPTQIPLHQIHESAAEEGIPLRATPTTTSRVLARDEASRCPARLLKG